MACCGHGGGGSARKRRRAVRELRGRGRCRRTAACSGRIPAHCRITLATVVRCQSVLAGLPIELCRCLTASWASAWVRSDHWNGLALRGPHTRRCTGQTCVHGSSRSARAARRDDSWGGRGTDKSMTGRGAEEVVCAGLKAPRARVLSLDTAHEARLGPCRARRGCGRCRRVRTSRAWRHGEAKTSRVGARGRTCGRLTKDLAAERKAQDCLGASEAERRRATTGSRREGTRRPRRSSPLAPDQSTARRLAPTQPTKRPAARTAAPVPPPPLLDTHPGASPTL